MSRVRIFFLTMGLILLYSMSPSILWAKFKEGFCL